jgi:predicted AlkP superfamily pyrophosphatase or phosphodiesterase
MLRRAFLLLALLASLLSAPAAEVPAKDRLVILVTVDGFPAWVWDDPALPMPFLQSLARDGAAAKAMKISNPAVTWPNHTTLVTGVPPGRHGVIGNNYFDRKKGEEVPLIPDPLFNKDEIVKVPTIYDVAKGAGLKTAAIIWPASRGAKSLDWTVPDVFKQELFEQYSTPSLLAEFKTAGIPYENQEKWCRDNKDGGIQRDRMYTRMFNHILRRHRPNVGLLHLIEVDHVEHAKGPQSPEAYDAVAFADARVKEVWDTLQETHPGRATLIVASDHGFFQYQQQIQPNVKLRQEGLLKVEGTKIAGGQVRALSQGGACFLYVLDNANRETLVNRLAEMFWGVEGVSLVIRPRDFAKFGLADPRQDPRMADLVLSAKEGYSFTSTAIGDVIVTPKAETVKGTHGYDPNEPRMHGSFIAWGAGIQPGAKLNTINNTDVAPTMAALLGLEMKNVEGRVLKEILK